MKHNKNLFYLPNLLTFSRIALTPLFVYLTFLGGFYLFFAVLIFTIAALTDIGDGFFARRYKVVSKYGAFLDPLADKVLIMFAFITFYFLGIIQLWMVMIIILRDLIITGLRIFMLNNAKGMKTSLFAKGKTVFQIYAIYLIFVYLIIKYWFENQNLLNCMKLAVDVSMYFVVAMTVYSGIVYLVKNMKFIKKENLIKAFCELTATFFYIGYTPIGPGTAASFATAFILFLIPEIPITYLVITLIALFLIGLWTSNEVEIQSKKHDPSKIVIDEVLGMFISVLFLPKILWLYVLAFLLFRFFDVVKFFPSNYAEKLSGGWGIMLDDVIAGLWTIGTLFLIRFFGFY